MIRRLLSTFFLALFLFNVVGYYGIFWLARERSNARLIQRIDNDRYQDDELFTIKLPLSLPYPLSGKDYERVHGSFQHEGNFYKLIKQKLEKDTLYIVCIKDHQEKRLFNAMADYTRASQDFPTNSKTLKLLSGFCKDFETTHAIEIKTTLIKPSDLPLAQPSSALQEGNIEIISPPPRPFC